MKKVIYILLLVCSIFAVSSCGKKNKTTKLSTPIVTVDGDGLASWKAVENASMYTYKINDGEEVTITELSVQLNDGESIVVMAVSDDEDYTNSDYSTSVSYLKVEETPTVEITETPEVTKTPEVTETPIDTPTPETYYIVVVLANIEHGEVTASAELALEFDLITINVEPEEGYKLEALYLNNVELEYPMFIMDACDAFIYATFTKIEEKPSIDLSTIKFDGAEFTYDGSVKSLQVTGLPAGCSVVYENNNNKEVGSYVVVAIIKDSNNNTLKTMNATLVIKAAGTNPEPTPTPGLDIDDVTFASNSFSYDGAEKSIYVLGLPSGYTVNYEGNGVSAAGTHTVIAKIYDSNNNLVKTLEATITIVNGVDVELPLV